jgi:outer membrane protein OmpA-like peptidoglycan-associated protein
VTTAETASTVPPLPESVSESVLFAARSAELSPTAARKLEALAPALRQLASRSAGAYLSVAAFADHREGGKASQYAIQRSELVRAWLLAHGVPRERIRTSIRVLDAGEAAGNRRVEIRSAD